MCCHGRLRLCHDTVWQPQNFSILSTGARLRIVLSPISEPEAMAARAVSIKSEEQQPYDATTCLDLGSPEPESHVYGPRLFKCFHEGCSASFRKPIRLTWHLKTHTGERPYRCMVPGCSKSFTRPYHLTRHTQKSHGSDLSSPSEFPCTTPDCGKILHTQALLDRHVKRVHGNVARLSCSVCGKSFRHKHQLKTHEASHNGDLPFTCTHPDCSSGFLTHARLIRHLKSHDGYKCTVLDCGKVFSKWSLLRKHRAVTHRKLHVCPQCRKEFARNAILEEHLVTHGEERKCATCSMCQRVLASAKSLKDHENRCPGKKDKLVCDYPGCGRIYARKPNFEKHKKLHEGDSGKVGFLI